MLITNSEVIKESTIFRCDKKTSDILLNNGFPLLSLDKNIYIYKKTDELINFLNLRG